MLSARVFLILILGSLLSAGCTVRSPLARPEPDDPRAQLPDKVRVHTRDGLTFELVHPTVEGDSLIGFVQTEYHVHVASRLQRTAIALHDIQAIEQTRISAWRTIALGLGVGLFAAGVALAIALSQLGPNSF
jgi:hypothetical protein